MVKKSEARYTNFKITNECMIRYQGGEFRVEVLGIKGYKLTENKPSGFVKIFAKSQLMRDINLGLVDLEPRYFCDEAIKARLFELERDLDPTDMTLDTRRRVRAVTAFVNGIKAGQWARHKDSAIEFLKQFADAEARIEQAHVTDEKLRGGTAIDRNVQRASDKHMIEWRQFLRLVGRYLEHGSSPSTLISNNRGSIPGTRISFETQSFIRMQFLTVQQISAAAILLEIEAENTRRREVGLDRFLDEPDIRTIQRFTKSIRDLHKEAGRRTAKEAKLDYRLSYGGPNAERPLERVEMDEKLLDVEVFLTETGLMKVIHPVALKRILELDREEISRDKKKRKKSDKIKRLWLSVAFDVATRSVLAAKILRTVQPTARDAIEVLEMAVNSKAHITEYLKTETPWPQHGRPEWVFGDHGAYATFEFQDCVTALGCNPVNPPVDNPYLRGAIERFFRTLDDRYMHMFPGRTYGNIITRGDIDPRELTALNDVELAQCLVRLIVDCYHNAAHSGIADLSPLEAWYFLNESNDVELVPKNIQRRAFAVTLRGRKITNDGFVVMGLPYGDARVQDLRNESKDAEFTIRVSSKSLKKIWVRKLANDGYIELECSLPVDDDMTFYEWRSTLNHLTSENKKKLEGNWENAKRARNEVRKMVSDAQNKAGITIAPLTDEAIEEVERDTCKGVVFKAQSEPDYGKEMDADRDPGDGSRGVSDDRQPRSESLDDMFGDANDGSVRNPSRFAEQPEAGERREARRSAKTNASDDLPKDNALPEAGRTRTRLNRPANVWNDDDED